MHPMLLGRKSDKNEWERLIQMKKEIPFLINTQFCLIIQTTQIVWLPLQCGKKTPIRSKSAINKSHAAATVCSMQSSENYTFKWQTNTWEKLEDIISITAWYFEMFVDTPLIPYVRFWLWDSNNCELRVFQELAIKSIAKYNLSIFCYTVWGWRTQHNY